MELDDPPRDRKPKAGAALSPRGRAIGLLKLLENAFARLGGHAGTGVAHGRLSKVAAWTAAGAYMRIFPHHGAARSTCRRLAAVSGQDYWMVRCNASPVVAGHTITRVSVDDSLQPVMAKNVVTGILSKGVNENIHIRKDHGVPIRSSRSLDRFRSTPGNVPPDELETGNRTRVRLAGFASASTFFNPSSTREVSVRPCSAAFFLALRSSSSGSRIVVLLCQRRFPAGSGSLIASVFLDHRDELARRMQLRRARPLTVFARPPDPRR